MRRRSIARTLFIVFAVVYYVARIAIFYAGSQGDMAFEEEQSPLVEAFVLYSFFAIGAAGLALIPGVYLSKAWGIWGSIAVSAYTIAFDVWAAVFVQPSAGMGIIAASVILGYLVFTRDDFEERGR